MYCYVIFGESDDKHTRKYLYKCDELTPGDTVIVPVKNSQKIALVYNTLKTIPEGFGLLDNRIKTDPIEFTDKYLKIELELERLIRKEIGEGGYMGFCRKYWRTKKIY